MLGAPQNYVFQGRTQHVIQGQACTKIRRTGIKKNLRTVENKLTGANSERKELKTFAAPHDKVAHTS